MLHKEYCIIIIIEKTGSVNMSYLYLLQNKSHKVEDFYSEYVL